MLLGTAVLAVNAIFVLVIVLNRLFTVFSRYWLKRIFDIAVCVFGILSPLALIMIVAAAHDIFLDYLSTPLFNRFHTDLPRWYVASVHDCPGEWNVLMIGIIVILVLQVLLFARFLVALINSAEGRSAVPSTAVPAGL